LKKLSILLLVLVIVVFGATTGFTENFAEEVVNKYKEKLPIGEVVNYTTETDPNELLGRPGQYIDKISWEDSRIDQSEDDLKGGTIELFDSKETLENRTDYLEQFVETPMFAQYMYVHNLVIVRIDKELTPEQAEEYEKILKSFE